MAHFEPKEMRINVRISPEQKAVIALAAQLQHTTISHFVIENAYQAANKFISEQTHIEMDEKQFEYFCQVLDNPPKANLDAMRDLLNKPGVLDE